MTGTELEELRKRCETARITREANEKEFKTYEQMALDLQKEGFEICDIMTALNGKVNPNHSIRIAELLHLNKEKSDD